MSSIQFFNVVLHCSLVDDSGLIVDFDAVYMPIQLRM